MIIAARGKNVWDDPVLAQLILWNDALPHDGPRNMAIDEWLWQNATAPTLRVYRWLGHWMSIGYFSKHVSVPAGCDFVRRPTGGGVVDHRDDWTYTLVVPRGHGIAELPGAESYRLIHQALCEALRAEGVDCALVTAESEATGDRCFVKPVLHDLIDANGNKIAGAGQRRGRNGLLHQGSVVVPVEAAQRGERIAGLLADEVKDVLLEPEDGWLKEWSLQVYENRIWNAKR
jgi:lipoyl(octanoyl) transferase